MNENINLVEILKDCPKGTKLYSPIFGEGEFLRINNDDDSFPIVVISEGGVPNCFDATGKNYYSHNEAECLLFPSKEQRDWSKFKENKSKFDPKTLQPFDKVLVRDGHGDDCDYCIWKCDLYSNTIYDSVVNQNEYWCVGNSYTYCIPYNEDTKHLVGTTEDEPEFYRYWEE